MSKLMEEKEISEGEPLTNSNNGGQIKGQEAESSLDGEGSDASMSDEDISALNS